MKRTLIIDAYNYIFAGDKKVVADIEKAREDLIESVIGFNARTGDFDDIVLVFDGKEKQTIRKLGVTVVFSDKKKSADQTIEKLIASSDDKQNVTLVSNDNVSRNLASGFGAKTFSTEWFRTVSGMSDESDRPLANTSKKFTVEESLIPETRLKLNKLIGRTSENDET